MSGHSMGMTELKNEKNDAIEETGIHFFLLITLVMACRMIVPAFSISFLVRPMVTHTFKAAGTTCFGWKLSSRVLRRVIRTPLARHYRKQSAKPLSKGRLVKSFDTHLIDHILQEELLVLIRQLLRSNDLRLDDQNEDWVLRRASTVNPITARIQLSPHGLCELPKLRDCFRAVLEQVDSGASGSGKKSRKRRREGVCCSRDTLVMHNLLGPSTEASACHKRASQ